LLAGNIEQPARLGAVAPPEPPGGGMIGGVVHATTAAAPERHAIVAKMRPLTDAASASHRLRLEAS